MAKRITITFFVALTLLGAAACGSSSASGSSSGSGNGAVASNQSVVALVSTSGVVNRAQATCIADKAAPKLSASGLKIAGNTEDGSLHLDNGDRKVLFAAFDACVTTAQIAPAVAENVPTRLGAAISSKAKVCIEGKLTKQYKTSGELMDVDWTGDSSAVESMADSCMSN